jgi:DNA-binding transcriptional LysR family regulator
MDRFAAMQIFVKVAEARSFALAARQLRLNPPAVTRAIARLEEIVGTRLFVRTTRSVTLTEAGERYVEDCRRILSDLREADEAAAGSFSRPSGTLTVTASVLFGQIYILPILLDYLDAHPDVSVRSLFIDRVTNLVEEGIDVAVRIGNLPSSSLTAVRVGTVHQVICGSPDYFQRFGRPTAPGELAAHRLIASSSAWSPIEWHFGEDGKTVVAIAPRIISSGNEPAIEAAARGWGLTRALSYQIAPLVAQGRLVPILTEFQPDPLPIHIVQAEGRQPTAKIRSFVQFAAQRLRGNAFLNLQH